MAFLDDEKSGFELLEMFNPQVAKMMRPGLKERGQDMAMDLLDMGVGGPLRVAGKAVLSNNSPMLKSLRATAKRVEDRLANVGLAMKQGLSHFEGLPATQETLDKLLQKKLWLKDQMDGLIEEDLFHGFMGEYGDDVSQHLGLLSGAKKVSAEAEKLYGENKFPSFVRDSIANLLSFSTKRKDLWNSERELMEEFFASPRVKKASLFGSGATTKSQINDLDFLTSVEPNRTEILHAATQFPIGERMDKLVEFAARKITPHEIAWPIVQKLKIKPEDIKAHFVGTSKGVPSESYKNALEQYGISKRGYGPKYNMIRILGAMGMLGGLGAMEGLENE